MGRKQQKGYDSYCHEYVGWPPISLEMSKNGNYNLWKLIKSWKKKKRRKNRKLMIKMKTMILDEYPIKSVHKVDSIF